MQTTIHDPVLGTLVHDGYYYEGTAQFNGSPFGFSVGTYEVDDVEARLERGRAVLQSLPAVIERAKSHAVKTLLDLKNDTWTEEDGRTIGPAEFEARLTIASITVDHDAELVIYFDAGDLFFGHHILVTETAEGELCRGEIQG